MNYHSKSYSLDDDVVALMDGLKAKYGSYNKGLRATLIDGNSVPAPCDHQAVINEQAKTIEDYEAMIALMNDGEIPMGKSDVPARAETAIGALREEPQSMDRLRRIAAGETDAVRETGAELEGSAKNCRCVHCAGRFQGPRVATLCPACEDLGHRGDPRDCRECQLNQGAI